MRPSASEWLTTSAQLRRRRTEGFELRPVGADRRPKRDPVLAGLEHFGQLGGSHRPLRLDLLERVFAPPIKAHVELPLSHHAAREEQRSLRALECDRGQRGCAGDLEIRGVSQCLRGGKPDAKAGERAGAEADRDPLQGFERKSMALQELHDRRRQHLALLARRAERLLLHRDQSAVGALDQGQGKGQRRCVQGDQHGAGSIAIGSVRAEVQPHRYHARGDHPKLSRRRLRQVDNPLSGERPPVVDPDLDAAPVVQIHHRHAGAEPERAVSRGHLARIEDFSIGRATAPKLRPVVGGQPLADECAPFVGIGARASNAAACPEEHNGSRCASPPQSRALRSAAA